MRSRTLPILLGLIIGLLIIVGIYYNQSQKNAPTGTETPPAAATVPVTQPSPGGSPGPTGPSGVPSPAPAANVTPGPSGAPSSVDLETDASGLSKATAVITTNEGVIKFKFYPKDAPNTVNRIIELIQKGFYNGLTFFRVDKGFVVQTGDPENVGRGGSGQKLKAEFNYRHHVEGTVAMARVQSDPDSADSQFYISLGTHPYLDHEYTVFGQVVQGMDVVKKIKIGDKMLSVKIE